MSDPIPAPTPADRERDQVADYAACVAAPECWYIPADVHPENRDELRDDWLITAQLGLPAYIRLYVAEKARAARLVELLRLLEWHGRFTTFDSDGRNCPCCDWASYEGHAADCELDAALKEIPHA